MARPSKIRRLAVLMNGEAVGDWTIGPRGRHEFRYDATWLDSPLARPISLSMPLQPPDVAYRDERVEAFFDNLLPEGAELRRRVQSRFGTPSTDPFDLLAEIGRDCVGAIQLVAPDAEPQDVRRIDGDPLTQAGVARTLRATVAPGAPGQREQDAFRISIAGVQDKTALLLHEGRWHRPRGATPTTHIFKLPLGRVGLQQLDQSTSIENEWLCLRILAAHGIPTAHGTLAGFEDQRVLIVERFDRRLAPSGGWWMRLPQEDFCQATGTPPARKYETDGGPGIRDVMTVLLAADEARADRRTFFKAQILFWMLAAMDGHAKNFSIFIGPAGRFSLTPLYDVLSAYPIMGTGAERLAPPKVRMAMAVSGTSRHYDRAGIVPRHWLDTARACDFAAEAPDILDGLTARTPEALDTVASDLPRDFPDAVAGPILEGVGAAAKQLAARGR